MRDALAFLYLVVGLVVVLALCIYVGSLAPA